MRTLIIAALASTVCACGERASFTEPSASADARTATPLSIARTDDRAPRKIAIRGRVIDFRTEQGVTGRTIQLRDPHAGNYSTPLGPGGYYAFSVPRGFFDVMLNNRYIGRARVMQTTFSGDFLIDEAFCISRYGVISDRRSMKPVQGAVVSLTGRTTISGPDGWYRIDLGCPSRPQTGGTTLINVTHPNYSPRSQVVGRGVSAVQRLDLDLEPLTPAEIGRPR